MAYGSAGGAQRLGERAGVRPSRGRSAARLPGAHTAPVTGGFSPGPAVCARLADGRAVFLKGAGSAPNPLSPRMHRREAQVLDVLPPEVPAARLLGVVDDGDWVVLAVEWVVGRLPEPTAPADLARLLALVERLAETGRDADLPGIEPFAEVHTGLTGNWIRLAAHPLPGLDAWSLRHLDRLAELDALALAATAGSGLVHMDLRSDNVLLADAGPTGDVVVDWTAAARGAPWLDLAGLAPALHLDGGPPPVEVFGRHPVGRAADPEAVDAFVVALAGYFTRRALLPPPPGLPTVRAFQAQQGAITRRWVAARLGL